MLVDINRIATEVSDAYQSSRHTQPVGHGRGKHPAGLGKHPSGRGTHPTGRGKQLSGLGQGKRVNVYGQGKRASSLCRVARTPAPLPAVRGKQLAAMANVRVPCKAAPVKRVSRVMSEIIKQCKSDKFALPKAPFKREVKQIIADEHPWVTRFNPEALGFLQAAAEDHLVDVLGQSRANAEHASRLTIMKVDIDKTKRDWQRKGWMRLTK